MSAWRRVAIEKFPDLRECVEQAKTFGMFWIELYLDFQRAHEEPADLEKISRCYDFAWWCFNELHREDMADMVGMSFYENLTTNPLVRERLPEFLTNEQFSEVAPYLAYFLGPEKFSEFCEEFKERRKQFEEKRNVRPPMGAA